MVEIVDVIAAFSTPLQLAWFVWLVWGVGLIVWQARGRRAPVVTPAAAPRGVRNAIHPQRRANAVARAPYRLPQREPVLPRASVASAIRPSHDMGNSIPLAGPANAGGETVAAVLEQGMPEQRAPVRTSSRSMTSTPADDASTRAAESANESRRKRRRRTRRGAPPNATTEVD